MKKAPNKFQPRGNDKAIFYISAWKRLPCLLASTCLIFLGMMTSIHCSKEKKPNGLLKQLVAQSRPTSLKVLLVGIDGLTFKVMNPMIAEGKLPLMKRLMRNGSYGLLESDRPMNSPALWTSIITGRRREAHGIMEFLSVSNKDKNRKILVNSNDRLVSSLWNWVGPFGKKVGFAGWWGSWPAESVNGWIISDRITRSRWSEWTDGLKYQNLTYPPDLMEELGPMIIDPEDPPLEEIHELVQFTKDELREFKAVRKPIFAHGLSIFKFAYCSQRTYEEMVLWMIGKAQPDLTGVYLIALDPICHTFWHFYEPDKFEGVDMEKANRLGQLIPNFYGHNEHYLAKMLEKIDSNTVVMIVSDHGFRASGIVPQAVSAEQFEAMKSNALERNIVAVGQSGMHQINGVLIVYGPPIRKGFKIENAHIFDIAPTILALMGLPVPEDLDGRVLTEIFDPLFAKNHRVQMCSSYENYLKRKKIKIFRDLDEKESLEKLRALGYIE